MPDHPPRATTILEAIDVSRTPVAANVLLVEDNDDDAALIARALIRADICAKTTRVETKSDFVAALAAAPDVIVSDFCLPSFSGLEALGLRNQLAPSVPFIVVTGTITDRQASDLVAAGVTDYLLKDRLGRLGTAVVRAMTERRTADQAGAAAVSAEESRRLTRALLEHAADAILLIDTTGTVSQANPATTRLFGDTTGVRAVDLLAHRVHPDDLDRVRRALHAIFTAPGAHPAIAFRVRGPTGSWLQVSWSANNLIGDPGVRGIVVNARDTTTEVEQLLRIEQGQEALVDALARAAEVRDPYTAGHQRKVATWSVRIAEQLGLAPEIIRQIDLGAKLHDIGKIAIPAEILTRPGRLSPLERQLVETHSQIGYDILTDSGMSGIVTDIVQHHHERLDGSGYPDRLAASEIAVSTRTVSVADVLDAMTSSRPYREALGLPAAREELIKGRGTLYCPDVVDAFLSLERRRA